MLIDILPVWLLFFVTTGLVVLSVETGYYLGRLVRGKTEAEKESATSSISGVILGLLAFILAFTFSIASNRYDNKKALVREEANVIRTAWERSDFLQEAERAKTKKLLREYVDQRVSVTQQYDSELSKQSLSDSRRVHREIWEMAVANGRIDMNSDIGALFVESVNEISKLHSMRVALGLQARIPTAIWLALFGLLILGTTSVGYFIAIADSRRSRVTVILAISFSLVITMIAALDHPSDSIIPVSQLPMVNLQSELKETNDPEY